MNSNLINKYVWLVETLMTGGRLTFKEINSKWMQSPYCTDGEGIPLRTFHKWKVEVELMFGVNIMCDCKDKYRYFIENIEDVVRGGMRNWLLSSISVNSMIGSNSFLRDRILLDKVPSERHLKAVLDAMRNAKTLSVLYHGFDKKNASLYEIEPYYVKLFKKRWYLIGKKSNESQVKIFALDRIMELEQTLNKYTLPKDLSAEELFDGCYGIFVGESEKERVVIKATKMQANYMRSLPFHSTQEEIETAEDYSVFSYNMKITRDFKNELLSKGARIEVLEPEWLRNDIADELREALERYC